jgi:protein-S-isoprenylcysteine O-methyltransferase Ste14
MAPAQMELTHLSGERVMHMKILPPTGLLIALLLMAGLHLAIPVTTIIPPLARLLGLIPLGVGIALNLSAERAFHQARTTIKPFENPSRLVTRGAFSFSRNPMYLGLALILTGVAVLLGSLAPFLILPLFAVWIDRTFIPYEEQALRQEFGLEWLAYKQNTRRWL